MLKVIRRENTNFKISFYRNNNVQIRFLIISPDINTLIILSTLSADKNDILQF